MALAAMPEFGKLPDFEAFNPFATTGSFGAATKSAPVAATSGSPAVVAGTAPGSGGFWNSLGGIVSGAAQTAADFGTSLLQLKLFERANNVAAQNTANTTNQTATGTGQTNQSTSGTGSGDFLSKVPGGMATVIGVSIALVGVVILMKRPG